MRFLILNLFSRNSLAAVKGLDREYDLIGGAYSQSRFQPLLKHLRTKRVSEVFWYSNPLIDPEAFLDDIIRAVEEFRPDGIISSGTTDTNFLSYYKDEIVTKTGTHVLVDDFDKLGKLTDKFEIFNICSKIGVPMPRTALLKELTTLERVIDDEGLKFPVVIKPRNSYASIGVKFFESNNDIVHFLHSKNMSLFRRLGDYVVQEKIIGSLHDVTSCAYKGEIISMLSQERLLSLCDFGGGGIVNRTTIEPEIIGYAEKIIGHMKFSGIALFDFIKSGTGYYLLECNPKIWGTTQLTIEAGLNVIQQLVDSHLFRTHSIPRPDYEAGLVYKWIFPECVAHWFQKPYGLSRIVNRIGNTFRRYEGTRTLNNLSLDNFIHSMGVILASY